MKKIRLIFSDNEGCILTGKGLPFPLEDMAELTSFLKDHQNVSFTLCSGRSVPYMEAMVQALDLVDSEFPCICEGGASLYWPKTDTWEVISPLAEEANLLEVVSHLNYRKEPGKVACLSLYPNPPNTVDELYEAYSQSPIFSKYTVAKSTAAVDITARGTSKSFGIQEVCRRFGIDLSEILYIGDAANDVDPIKLAGFSACPHNGWVVVKELVDFIASSDATKGVIEILEHFEPYFCQ